MNKIQSRDYTVKEKGTLKPTELGRVIAKMLEDNFKQIMDIGFTATMEDSLELVAENQKNWKELIRSFWHDFIPTVETAEKEAFVPKVLTEIDCPSCGHKLQKIWSKKKYFYGCSNYPECSFTAPLESLNFNKDDYDPSFNWDQPCPHCGSNMIVRHGKYGAFLGCSSYPKCRGIVNIPKKGEMVAEDMPTCPALGCDGKMVQRRSRFGKIFYSCSNYPDCDVIANDLDHLLEKYIDHPKTPYIKKTKSKQGGGKKGSASAKGEKKPKKAAPVQKAHSLSKELQAVVGAKQLSRPEVMKKVWDYIKTHGCTDPKSGRRIVPDAKLSALFGSSQPIDMLQLPKILSGHILKEKKEKN